MLDFFGFIHATQAQPGDCRNSDSALLHKILFHVLICSCFAPTRVVSVNLAGASSLLYWTCLHMMAPPTFMVLQKNGSVVHVQAEDRLT